MSGLREAFHSVVDTHTAGDPMRDDIRWTHLSRPEIAAALNSEGFEVGQHVVDCLLKDEGFARRTAAKVKTMGDSPDRDAQFLRLAELQADYLAAGEPVLSMDTKKREMLGDYARSGSVWATGRLRAWDHDFPTHSPGKAAPHGLYDLARNEGWMHLTLSHDTSEFAADCLLDWWRERGRRRYPSAQRLLLLCDGGGSNSCRSDVFKDQLQDVADCTGLAIRVGHYPPHCSKFNPIERRLFSQLTRACSGQFLTSAEHYRDLLNRVRTSVGLRVAAKVMCKVYEIGKTVRDDFLERLKIFYDASLPKWNYIVQPN